MALSEEKKKLWSHPSLINRSMNRYDVLCKGYSPMPKMVTKSFVEKKFHAPNGKAQACTQGALLFFLLSSHCVPQHVPQVPNVFLNMFSMAPHFYHICFGKCCPPFTCVGGPKGRNSIPQNRAFYFGEPS
jgi:hypothetical protein